MLSHFIYEQSGYICWFSYQVTEMITERKLMSIMQSFLFINGIQQIDSYIFFLIQIYGLTILLINAL